MMAEQNKDGTDPAVKDPEPTPTEKAIMVKLNETTELMNKQQADFNTMLSDPDVVKVIEMKKQGQEVVIGAPDEKIDPLEEFLGPLDSSDDSDGQLSGKDVLKHVGDKLPALIADGVAKAVAPLVEQIVKLKEQNTATQMTAQDAVLNDAVGAAIAKYPDLADYKEDMIELDAQMPGISVERAYVMAKTERVGSFEDSHSSERPVNILEQVAVHTAKSSVDVVAAMQPKGDSSRTRFSTKLNEVLDNRYGST